MAPPPREDPRVEPDSTPPARASRRPEASERLFAERYRLTSRVGKGGMAEVWAADDTRTGARVALKIVSMDACDPGMSRARFRREAELAKQLRGAAFVEVFDHGVCEEGAFVSMELLRGESLHERLDRGVSFSLDEARALLVGVGTALRVAHALQVVHRDIKPGNVFFARLETKRSGIQPIDGRSETIKLLDFGIAKDAWDEARLTRPGMVLGSAFYMSPEQIRSSRDVDARADLWSLAIIMYMALTSQRPFGSEPSAALARILVDPAPPPSTFRRDLPPSVDAFFARALAKDVARRFQTIDEMIEGFDAALSPASDEVDVDLESDVSSPVALDAGATSVRNAMREAPTRIYPAAESATAPAPPVRRAAVSPSMPPYLARGGSRGWVANLFAVLLVAGLAFAAWWFRADIVRLLP